MTDPLHRLRRTHLVPLLVPLLAVLVAGLGVIWLSSWVRTTVVILVRHAEAATATTGDPDLSPAGERRAACGKVTAAVWYARLKRAIDVVGAVGGLVAGWRVTISRPILPASQAAPETGFWKVLYHKYYVDEFYEAAIVGPLRRLSARVLWKDVAQGIIDRGGVEGSAGLARTLGWIGTRLQTGQVGLYLTVFLVGALGIFFVVMG